jgi:predicted DNA repair protein MutK
MASGFFALLDDIALLADDVAVTTKVASQKTASILADDLAVNAQKATGFSQDRELKVLWAITKGSFINKVIILPLAFLLSIFVPVLIPIILVIGGLYLLYEGAEKIHEVLFHHSDSAHEEELKASTKDNVLDIEKKKIKAAVVTDFILSIEIIILALNTVLEQPLMIQIVTTTIVAILATVFVYGLVGLIIRLDNIGFWLIARGKNGLGQFLIELMPKIIKVLSFVGTVAMILVGGGILTHNIDAMHHLLITGVGLVDDFLLGLLVGMVVLGLVSVAKKIRG